MIMTKILMKSNYAKLYRHLPASNRYWLFLISLINDLTILSKTINILTEDEKFPKSHYEFKEYKLIKH